MRSDLGAVDHDGVGLVGELGAGTSGCPSTAPWLTVNPAVVARGASTSWSEANSPSPMVGIRSGAMSRLPVPCLLIGAGAMAPVPALYFALCSAAIDCVRARFKRTLCSTDSATDDPAPDTTDASSALRRRLARRRSDSILAVCARRTFHIFTSRTMRSSLTTRSTRMIRPARVPACAATPTNRTPPADCWLASTTTGKSIKIDAVAAWGSEGRVRGRRGGQRGCQRWSTRTIAATPPRGVGTHQV